MGGNWADPAREATAPNFIAFAVEGYPGVPIRRGGTLGLAIGSSDSIRR